MSESKRHFYVCAIGPVQDFIATARASHDLWFGSWMLSELCKAAAKAISDQSQQLIFPAPENERDLDAGSTLSVANKIAAIIEGDPNAVADYVWQAVQDRLEQLCQETFDRVKGRLDEELAQEQIADLVEFYWASAPYTDQSSYKTVRVQAEALLAARKNTRNFRQINGREGTPKSSLDGFRETVLLDSSNSVGAGAFYAAYRAEPGEALSGIDLLKRWGEKAQSFPSTTDVAALPFLMMIRERKLHALQRIKALLATYTDHPETEGTHFYEERLIQLIPDKTRWSEFRRQFAGIFREEGIHQRPSPYYILLLADGDNMGKTIDAQDNPEKHRTLSQRLSTFASTAYQTIERYDGAPIYVGGDDVLAYLPLHTALRCVTDLNEKFNRAMQGFSFSDDKGQHSPMLSGALVIAHHLTPLGEVLETARQAEKKAKGISGKNGLVIVLSKRGGMDRTAGAKVDDLAERMQVLIEYVRQKQISASTAYELEKLHQQLSESGLPADAFQREATRIIQRKREVGGGREVREKVRLKFEAWFKDADLPLDELAHEMVIAGEFAKACEMATKETRA